MNEINKLLENKTYIKHKFLIQLIIIALASVLVYINTFPNTFIMDDRTIFFDWPETKNFEIKSLLQGSYPDKFGFHPVYRPLKGVLHAISYNLSGNSSVFYHLQGIVIHTLISILIFNITTLITKRNGVAFITAIIFAVHPIHTEAVTFMTASFDTAGILLFFTSFYLYLKYKQDQKKILYFFSSVIFSALAFLTYEMTLVLPALIIFYDLCFKNLTLKKIKSSIEYLPYFISVALYFGLRSVFQTQNEITYYAGNLYLTSLLALKSLLMYLYLIFAPIKQSVLHLLPGGINSSLFDDNSVDNFKLIQSQSILEPSVLIAILILIFSAILFFYFFKKKPVISFSIAWFYIALIPVSNIIFPLRQVMAERFTYIASFGIILLFSYVIVSIYESNKLKKNIKQIIPYLIIFIVIFLSILTIMRNFEYKTEIDMFKDLSAKEVGGEYFQHFLGKYYFISKNYEESIYYLEKLNESNSTENFQDGNFYLALSYLRIGNIPKAQEAYSKLMSTYPNFSKRSASNLDSLIKNSQKPNDNNQTISIDTKLYKQKNNFSFEYPSDWQINKVPDNISILNPQTGFKIIFQYNILSPKETKENYVADSSVNKFSKLIQQGKANVPSANYAYARIWENNETKIGHFILINGADVVEVVAAPFESNNLSDFNLIMNSIKFE